MTLETTEATKKKAAVSLATAATEEISMDAAVANVQSGLGGIFTIKGEQRVELNDLHRFWPAPKGEFLL